MAKAKSESVQAKELGGMAVPAVMKPKVFVFKICGKTALLQNNPAEFIGVTESDKMVAGKKKYDDAEEARRRTYFKDGKFWHPSDAFIRSMIRAATGKKFGKLSAPAVLKGSVFQVEPSCLLQDEDGEPLVDYAIDRRSVVVGGGKGKGGARVLRCRPSWTNWQTKLALELDVALITPDHVLDCLSLAGRIIGVGDFRPEKGGSFGRFTVEIEEE